MGGPTWLPEESAMHDHAEATSSTTVPTDASWQFQDRFATALDEMGVLHEMGAEGWELTGFGPFFLHFRRPEDPQRRRRWEHRRLVEFLETRQRPELEREGWILVGSWAATLHYYKRPV
jgi:hypothetical protein